MIKGNRLYVLDGHTPVPTTDITEWGLTFGSQSRIVATTDIGDVRISTVFLGVDHNFLSHGPPIVFETMVFGGVKDGYTDRCATWDEAEEMHAKAVRLVVETD